jgi:protein arginine kinase activator
MERKCDKCDRPATVHLTEIINGQKIEMHLCEHCANEEGLHIQTPGNVPLNELLNDFITNTTQEPPADAPAPDKPADLRCDLCGMTFSEYRDKGRLGCPNDYEAFADALVPMLMATHEGACEHIGKVPHRSGGEQERQTALLRLRAELKRAIAVEDYERAAVLRNQIQELEQA